MVSKKTLTRAYTTVLHTVNAHDNLMLLTVN